jgi:hypothetical protein
MLTEVVPSPDRLKVLSTKVDPPAVKVNVKLVGAAPGVATLTDPPPLGTGPLRVIRAVAVAPLKPVLPPGRLRVATVAIAIPVYPTEGGFVRPPLLVTLIVYAVAFVGVNVKVPPGDPGDSNTELGVNDPVPGELAGVTVTELTRLVADREKFPDGKLMFPLERVGPER